MELVSSLEFLSICFTSVFNFVTTSLVRVHLIRKRVIKELWLLSSQYRKSPSLVRAQKLCLLYFLSPIHLQFPSFQKTWAWALLLLFLLRLRVKGHSYRHVGSCAPPRNIKPNCFKGKLLISGRVERLGAEDVMMAAGITTSSSLGSLIFLKACFVFISLFLFALWFVFEHVFF